jgi:C4-dicarboxylate-specific signal transduction histidine kinase
VMHTHQFAVARRNKEWEVMEIAELKQAKAEIQRLNNDLERRVLQRTSELTAVNAELRRQMSERQRMSGGTPHRRGISLVISGNHREKRIGQSVSPPAIVANDWWNTASAKNFTPTFGAHERSP